MAGLNKKQRWQAALQTRDDARQAQRDKLYGGSSLTQPTASQGAPGTIKPLVKPMVMPSNQLMVRRGTSVIPLDHQAASNATAKSWPTRKKSYGKVGRVSKNTFQKKR